MKGEECRQTRRYMCDDVLEEDRMKQSDVNVCVCVVVYDDV
jgi:hypothetical protein